MILMYVNIYVFQNVSDFDFAFTGEIWMNQFLEILPLHDQITMLVTSMIKSDCYTILGSSLKRIPLTDSPTLKS